MKAFKKPLHKTFAALAATGVILPATANDLLTPPPFNPDAYTQNENNEPIAHNGQESSKDTPASLAKPATSKAVDLSDTEIRNIYRILDDSSPFYTYEDPRPLTNALPRTDSASLRTFIGPSSDLGKKTRYDYRFIDGINLDNTRRLHSYDNLAPYFQEKIPSFHGTKCVLFNLKGSSLCRRDVIGGKGTVEVYFDNSPQPDFMRHLTGEQRRQEAGIRLIIKK